MVPLLETQTEYERRGLGRIRWGGSWVGLWGTEKSGAIAALREEDRCPMRQRRSLGLAVRRVVGRGLMDGGT